MNFLVRNHQLPWGASISVTKRHEHFFQSTDGFRHIPFEGNTLTFFNWSWLNNSINPDIRIAYSHDKERGNRDDSTQAENPVMGQATNVPRNIMQVQRPSGSGQCPRPFQRPFCTGPRMPAPRENFGSSRIPGPFQRPFHMGPRMPRPRGNFGSSQPPRIIPGEGSQARSSSQCPQVLQPSSLSENSSVWIPSQTPLAPIVQETTVIPVNPEKQASIEADEEAKVLKIFLERLKASAPEEITAEYRKNKMFNEFYEQRDQRGMMAPLLSASHGKIFVRYLEKTYFNSKTPKGDQDGCKIGSFDEILLTGEFPEKSSSVERSGQKTPLQQKFPQSSCIGAASSSSKSGHSRNVSKESRNDQSSEAGPSSAVRAPRGTVTEELPINPISEAGPRISTSQPLPPNQHILEFPTFSGTGAASTSMPTNWNRMLQQIHQNPCDPLSDDFLSMTLEYNDPEIPRPSRKISYLHPQDIVFQKL